MSPPHDQFIVVTTIAAPTDAIHQLEARSNEWPMIVVGDNKTPPGWQAQGATYLSMDEQRASRWALARELPENHYCRKNLGYLEAIARGARVIAETDDDNFPTDWPPAHPTREVTSRRVLARGWLNPYPFFTAERIWPRGFPLEELARSYEPRETADGTWSAPVQQYLAEGDPDVDAVYRLTVGKDDHRFHDTSLVLGAGAITTFNSQCTIWFAETFPLLYLPSFVSFRMTDIWRSLVAQVCLWALGGELAYHGKGVRQDRNEHNLLRDFDDEVVGYLRNAAIADALLGLELADGPDAVTANLRTCYTTLRAMDVVTEAELAALEAWIGDLALAAS